MTPSGPCLLQDFGHGRKLAVGAELLEDRGEALAWADGCHSGGEFQSTASDGRSLFDLSRGKVGVSEPREVEARVLCVSVVVWSEHVFQNRDGAQRSA
ncbi:hypothetical protein SPAR_41239 [Streptomyces sparsogenes DSM 40356]|uniref:Uncharacterized protein n=1 Tax=Streptomyces sparsogenes DSM 40356 TaxID=1331668 RepID=A0A1R1S5B0_9ACTN|nr:hypothetical protein SPAR_41239 [Streptomyces sparsogenes DSM 40356]